MKPTLHKKKVLHCWDRTLTLQVSIVSQPDRLIYKFISVVERWQW